MLIRSHDYQRERRAVQAAATRTVITVITKNQHAALQAVSRRDFRP
ncbi:MAG: hypothetical protein J2P37_27780 [Ktedonobacteraceae bacterium]|nr:hypothetical protein [Ktedonobacteraceae bacterium]